MAQCNFPAALARRVWHGRRLDSFMRWVGLGKFDKRSKGTHKITSLHLYTNDYETRF